MRSSKSRSRSKPNRPRTLGNITNRVFDSSGPEGKVRGTPQQIIDKYLVLAREAQLSNDRVSAESCMQFAEHYTRMLGEATREMQAEQEARRAQDAQNQQNQQREYQQRDRGEGQQPDQRDDRDDGSREDRTRNGDRNNDRRDSPREDRNGDRNNDRRDAPRNRHVQRVEERAAPVVIDPQSGEGDSGLVETPETRRPRQHRQPRPKPAVDASVAPAEQVEKPTAPAAGEAEKPARKPRVARKPKSDAPDAAGKEAAE